MKKQKSHAFGKDVYLLGTDKYDRYLWLEAPSWDCGWYWGFGYVEEYTNHKRPNLAKDITCHTHWDYIHDKNEIPFKDTVFNTKEYNELKSLFLEFYELRKKCDAAHQTDEGLYKNLSKVEIPEVMGKIIKILTP